MAILLPHPQKCWCELRAAFHLLFMVFWGFDLREAAIYVPTEICDLVIQ